MTSANSAAYILGFSDSVHDRSVCLFKDNEPVIAIEEERMSRVKHALYASRELRKEPAFWTLVNLENSGSQQNENYLLPSINYCLDSVGLTLDDIDIMVGNSLHHSFPFHDRAIYLNHHLAHACSAFYASGFDEAAIFITDGYGDMADENTYETILLAKGTGHQIQEIKRIVGKAKNYYDMQHSVGVFYGLGTILAGFVTFEDGKLMGLSGYGEPVYYDAVKSCIDFHEGWVAIDNGTVWDKLSQEIANRDDFQVRANIASTFQTILEEIFFHYAEYLYKVTGSENLCIAGGVGLNCVANAKLLNRSPFKNVFVFPAAGDNGISFGAAYFAAHHILRLPRTQQLQHSYFGKTYSREAIGSTLQRYASKLDYQVKPTEDLAADAAELLAKQDVIMWFQAGSEIGPRALGHRSVLASPQRVETKDYINAHVKFREGFRPLAPIVLEEEASDYFDINCPSPFMLFSPQAKDVTKEIAAGIVHVDGTARLQTVNAEQNEKVHLLIRHFQDKTGVPIILNTSLNTKGEPIVETPEDTLKTFLNSPVNTLFMDDFRITKK